MGEKILASSFVNNRRLKHISPPKEVWEEAHKRLMELKAEEEQKKYNDKLSKNLDFEKLAKMIG